MNNNFSKYLQPILAVVVTLLISTFIKSRWSTLSQLSFIYNLALIFGIFIVVEQITKFVFNNFINKK